MSFDALEPDAYAAPFIFTGTIERTAAATMAPFPVDENTVVVAVDDVVQAPAGLRSFAGRNVTVHLLAPLKIGRYVFFADPWAIGSGIAVRERAHVSASAPSVRELVAAGLEDAVVKRLAERVPGAVLIALGTLGEAHQLVDVKVRPKGVPWAIATLEVEQILKGNATAHGIPVVGPLYASKYLVSAPPLRVGVRAIFLLRVPPAQAIEVVPAASRDMVRFVASTSDIQPVERHATIARIVGDASEERAP